MDGKRIAPSVQEIRTDFYVANGGAIIRHFNFRRNIFVAGAKMGCFRNSANWIDKTFKRQQALHRNA
jgi:hypothetical protein